MKFLTLILFVSLGANASDYFDRFCGIDPENLWLDVVLVVDNSNNMQKDDFSLVKTTINALFGQGTRIGINYDDPRSTRVALITYNNQAIAAANLNKYQSFSELSDGVQTILNDTINTSETYLSLALSKASDVLEAGRSNNYRSNYKQMVIVFAASYQTIDFMDPNVFADKLKSNNVSIAVVDFAKDTRLEPIASLHMYFRNEGQITENLSRAAFQVNCFCPQNWVKYHPYDGYYSGLCLQVSDLPLSWVQAKLTCQNMVRVGYLVTEFTKNKHEFVKSLVQTNTSHSVTDYHIGLTYINGGWNWQQPAGQEVVPLYQADQEAILWNTGYPTAATVNTGAASFIDDDGKAGWQNINVNTDKKRFVCERYTCDTDNYCP